jgi:4-amino-4-deoxy-L-arabinose transferase-like glycosyltransferase
MMKLSTKFLILAAIILLSVAGGGIAVYTTANGPWGYTDPVVYISTARSLDRGQGLVYYEADAAFRPITIEPPFYSIALSAIGLFRVNLVVAARWLNILAFIASIFIAGWIFYRYSRVPALGIVASALMCAFPYMVWMFSSAYSEPLFVLMFLSGGLGLLAYLQKEKTSLLLLSAVLIGLIPATRYAGIAMVIAGGVSVLLLASGKTRARIRKAVLFTFLASLPILLWLIWIYFSTAHSVGGRSLGLDWHGLAAQFQGFRGIFMDTVWKWVPFQSHGSLLGYRLRFFLMGVILVVLLGLSILAERRLHKDSEEGASNSGMRIFTFFGLSSLFFVAVLILTYLFTHPTIDVDNRMLLPLYAGSVMTVYAAFALWQAAWFRGKLLLLQALPWLIAIICVAWYFPQTRDEVNFYHAGDGLTAYRWGRSGIIQAVRALPPEQPVISNDWELLQLWTGRPIYGFWNTFPSKPLIQATAYGTAPGDPVQSVFCKQGAALVIVDDFTSQFQAQVGKAYDDQSLFAGLPVYGTYTDGKIYLCH